MKSNRENQAAYKSRMQDKGYVQLVIWVPKKDKEQIKKYINEICEQERTL